MADESIIKYSDIIGPDDTFDVIFENIEKLKTELTQLTEAFQKELSIIGPNEKKRLAEIGDELNKLAKTKKLLDNEEKKANRTRKRTQDLTDKQLEQLQREKIAQRERVQIAKQNAIINKTAEGSIEQLRAKLSLATLQWKKLSKNERENTVTGRNLVKTKKNLTNQLKRLEKATGDARRNVGNYSSALGRLGKIAVGVFLGRNIISGITRITNAIGSLIEKNKETNESIGEIDSAFERFKSSAGSLGLQLLEKLAKPIIFVVDGITNLFNLLSGKSPVEEFSATSEKLAEQTKSLNSELVKEQATAQALFITLKDVNISQDQRSKIIDKINTQYGQYIPNLLDEKSSLNDIEEAQKLVNLQLSRNFALKIQQTTLEDVLTKKIQNQFKAFEALQKKQGGAIPESLKAEFIEFSEILASNDELADRVFEFFDAKIGIGAGRAGQALKKFNVDGLLETSKKFESFFESGDEASAFFIGLTEDTKKSNEAIKGSQEAITALSNSIAENTFRTKEDIANTNKSTKSISDNVNQREALIKKIAEQTEKLRKAREKGDAKAEKDELTKLFRLEEIRFQLVENAREKAFQELLKKQKEQSAKLIEAGFDEESKKFKELQTKFDAEKAEAQKKSDEAEQENLRLHLENLFNIEKEFVEKTIKENEKLQTKQQEQFDKRIETELKTNQKLVEASAKQILDNAKATKDALKERAKEFGETVAETLNTISGFLVEAQNKNLEIATSLVDEQAEAVERQQERAEKGLTNTLAFEKQQLAERERERLEAERRQKQALEFQTLLNLVSAYARSGDANALQRGLVDFGILKGLELIGFKEGGYTGDHATDQIAGVTHGQEFVVRAEDTKKFGLVGKSGDQFGDTISDYFGDQSVLLTNPLEAQKNAFRTQMMDNDGQNINDLRTEIRDVRKAIEKMPKNDFDVLRMTDYFVEIANKVTSKRMTTVQKVRKKL